MPSAYRIFKTKHAQNWADGEGAFRFGGRWNSPGTRVFYAASSLSLAALEMLVNHESAALMSAYSYSRLDFPDSLVTPVAKVAKLPANWHASPPPIAIQEIGDLWARSAASAVLRVPSAVIEAEHNFVFNIAHRDFRRVKLSRPRLFRFDERLYNREKQVKKG